MNRERVQVGNIEVGGDRLTLIAGPCVIEDEEICLEVAEHVRDLAKELGVNYIFKSSFEKDNRSSPSAYKGPGLDKGLAILEKVRQQVGVPVLSDIHCRTQVEEAAQVLDVLQIPAYLSQQTELALAAGRTGKPINVKKGQFIAPEDMAGVVSKIRSTGNHKIILTERGTCFGYRRLVVDMRSFPILRSLGCPVIFDVTHSIRIYGLPSSDPRGGEPEFVPFLARAGVACGIDGIFIETHPCPDRALCDASSMIPLPKLKNLLEQVVAIDRTVRGFGNGR